MAAVTYSVSDLQRVMQRLRDPDAGCPWDIRQDFKTLVSSTLEECYELAQAIENEDHDHVAEELGDVLFQVIFYAQLGFEQGLFSFEEVVDTLACKLIRRHPHVFSGGELEGVVAQRTTVDAVNQSWELIKQEERKAKSLGGILDDVPLALPALPRAQKIQKRAAGVNFDWPDYHGALSKIHEELNELQDAAASGVTDDIEDEMGDLLFSCVNTARHLGVDAESCLRRANNKFETRFKEVANLAESSGHSLDQLSADELERLWIQAKHRVSSRA
jgi:ATP diphosphatase